MQQKVFQFTLLCLMLISFPVFSQNNNRLNDEIALQLSRLPLDCINQEYPNKTAHIINNSDEVKMSPADLHPAFYGCFDWHSSVHGHWMLVKLLKANPDIANRSEIIEVLSNSFQSEKLLAEAEYFTRFENAKFFERTYGWAWLLKLDEELITWDNPIAKKWHTDLQPLTKQIVETWKSYLPNQTYPNRTGVHPNSAFALGFAIDWARVAGEKEFEEQLIEKAKQFYLNDRKTPAYLEPDGADFFSPSLQIADLMARVLDGKAYSKWIKQFYTKQSIDNISQAPIISDINDYQIVHLVGLSFSKAWCMKNIAQNLPSKNNVGKHFNETADRLLNNALPLIFEGNYGGDHWLASFAVMALQ